MSPLPPTSSLEPQDDMMRQIHDRFDRVAAQFEEGFDRIDARFDAGSDHFDARLDRIERTMLKRSDLYPALMAAQLISFMFWVIVICGLARLGVFS